jgi:hypothetical protein
MPPAKTQQRPFHAYQQIDLFVRLPCGLPSIARADRLITKRVKKSGKNIRHFTKMLQPFL